jgi:hypothetical protein
MTEQSASPSSKLLPSLQEKLQRFAGELTPEEQAQMRMLVELASAGIAAIDGAEVEGYIAPGHDQALGLSIPNLHPGSQGYGYAAGHATGADQARAVWGFFGDVATAFGILGL